MDNDGIVGVDADVGRTITDNGACEGAGGFAGEHGD